MLTFPYYDCTREVATKFRLGGQPVVTMTSQFWWRHCYWTSQPKYWGGERPPPPPPQIFPFFDPFRHRVKVLTTNNWNCIKSEIGIIYLTTPFHLHEIFVCLILPLLRAKNLLIFKVYCITFVVTFQCSEISLTSSESKQDETKAW